MASLDDELALFESELAELNEPSVETHVGYDNATISAAPTTGPSLSIPEPPQQPLLMPPPFLGGPGPSPFIGGVLGRLPPMLPPGLAAASMFIPHQMRAPMPPMLASQGRLLPPPPMMSQSATIEGAPTVYEAPALNQVRPELLKTQALQSDIDKMNFKKQTDPFKKRIKDQQSKKKYVRSGGGQVWEDASLAEWDDNDFRVFCGDLGNEVSEELLAKAFRKYPSFQKAKVVRETRSNKSKGYGFVSFRESEDYVRAMREMDGKYVGNRPIKLRKSSWKDRNLDVIKKKKQKKKELGIIT